MNLPNSSTPETADLTTQQRFEGLLLGTAVGDALGLPAENLSPERIGRLWKGRWKMRFAFGRGMISDDTEHTLMVAQTLLSHPTDAATFQRSLAWKFRWWFAGLPGGMGLATAKACIRLWMGFPAHRSAVKSAGSGPAMRSAILGAYFANDTARRHEFVCASSRLTHKGWQAEVTALAVAEAAAYAARTSILNPTDVLAVLRPLSAEDEWQQKLFLLETSLAHHDPVSAYVHALGLEKGVTGYSLHVVPVALYAWLRHQTNFREALIATLECGGDIDTVGAILGALCGATGGAQCIPTEWINGIADWPRSIAFASAIANRLTAQQIAERPLGEVHYFWPIVILRNLFFLTIVILHGFRRLFPPY